MATYRVQHAYRSVRDGQPFGPWAAGDTAELDAADADWVNRDSPGCLEPAKAAAVEPDPPKERAAKPGANRQHRGSANRSV